ncbi:preprotein translocase subunit SecA, partial [Candidatus Saccharibacteria bacterium]|nr:preprotein translocase subunit SecA [Candidatus Saccharibacteria bacterium]
EDDLMRIFGGDRISKVMDRLKVDADVPIENRMISRSLESAQKKVEGFHFDQRKNVVQYDDVMNRHRKATYAMRKEILKADDISKRVKLYIDEELSLLADSPIRATEEFEPALKELLPLDEAALDRVFAKSQDTVKPVLLQEAKELYKAREAAFTSDIFRKVERDVYLQILDDLWMRHLENMDHLREGIGWMSVGQRDPLVEYRRRGQVIFEEMQHALRHEVVRALFHAEPIDPGQLERPVETELTLAARGSISNAADIIDDEAQFSEGDFTSGSPEKSAAKKSTSKQRAKANKRERQRKAKARRRK